MKRTRLRQVSAQREAAAKAAGSTFTKARTPLRAVAGIPRARGISARREPGKAAPKRPRREGGFSPAVRKAVRVRAGDRCEACGIGLPPGYGQIQHRLARKAGGRHGEMAAVVNSVQNAALLCGTPFTSCHGLAEARDEHMHGMGFWLEEGQDPALEPIMLHGEYGGVTVWLTEIGSYTTIPPKGVAA